ncbi:MAG: GNAT family N-acetyltransferase [Myxococcales bacterium]|nr:GNAT family N-acetyltransferase [Myxococcales bacterium]MCB9733375.1 GNAT family N-acetyltransferase [Deltaproteobacteria bacterium]
MTRAAHKVEDHAVIRAVLGQDPVGAAYMLGDLDPHYSGFCTWFLSGRRGEHDAVVLVYTGLSAPVVLAWGDRDGVGAILRGFVDQLPERAHVHMAPDHLAVVDKFFAIERLRPMLRMGLPADELQHVAASAPGGPEVVQLGHRDTGEIMELYQHYPDSFFEPSQLSTGHYYGVRVDGRLASVAGVHICNRVDRIAALGNIVTRPDMRGRGFSTACTGHLCERLVDDGFALLALNVERKNESAVRVYEKLGFRENSVYLEGFLERTLTHKVL